MDDDVRSRLGRLEGIIEQHDKDIRAFAAEVGKSLVLETQLESNREDGSRARQQVREEIAERIGTLNESLNQRFAQLSKDVGDVERRLDSNDQQARDLARTRSDRKWLAIGLSISFGALMVSLIIGVLSLVLG